MKRWLLLYLNLCGLACFSQIKHLTASPENLALSQQSLEFQLTKGKLQPGVIWNNYHSENDIPDTSRYNLSVVRIRCSIVYPASGDTAHIEPFIYTGHSAYTDQVIIIPYSRFELGMTFCMDLTDTVSSRRMRITVDIDSLADHSPNDRTFCFNYIPFLQGHYCFTGQAIEHWDVQTATINPDNVWEECRNISNSSIQQNEADKKPKTKPRK